MVEEKELELLDDELFSRRISVRLTPENTKFIASANNLISMEFKNANGETEVFERVVPLRAFPITNPDDFIAIRLPETKKKGKGSEIGMINSIYDFDKETQKILREELSRRYFTPQITRIYSFKEKFGFYYCDAETSSGKVSFVLNNPTSNIRTLEDRRVYISDIDGNCFEISDPQKLDKLSLKKIEIYL